MEAFKISQKSTQQKLEDALKMQEPETVIFDNWFQTLEKEDQDFEAMILQIMSSFQVVDSTWESTIQLIELLKMVLRSALVMNDKTIQLGMLKRAFPAIIQIHSDLAKVFMIEKKLKIGPPTTPEDIVTIPGLFLWAKPGVWSKKIQKKVTDFKKKPRRNNRKQIKTYKAKKPNEEEPDESDEPEEPEDFKEPDQEQRGSEDQNNPNGHNQSDHSESDDSDYSDEDHDGKQQKGKNTRKNREDSPGWLNSPSRRKTKNSKILRPAGPFPNPPEEGEYKYNGISVPEKQEKRNNLTQETKNTNTNIEIQSPPPILQGSKPTINNKNTKRKKPNWDSERTQMVKETYPRNDRTKNHRTNKQLNICLAHLLTTKTRWGISINSKPQKNKSVPKMREIFTHQFDRNQKTSHLKTLDDKHRFIKGLLSYKNGRQRQKVHSIQIPKQKLPISQDALWAQYCTLRVPKNHVIHCPTESREIHRLHNNSISGRFYNIRSRQTKGKKSNRKSHTTTQRIWIQNKREKIANKANKKTAVLGPQHRRKNINYQQKKIEINGKTKKRSQEKIRNKTTIISSSRNYNVKRPLNTSTETFIKTNLPISNEGIPGLCAKKKSQKMERKIRDKQHTRTLLEMVSRIDKRKQTTTRLFRKRGNNVGDQRRLGKGIGLLDTKNEITQEQKLFKGRKGPSHSSEGTDSCERMSRLHKQGSQKQTHHPLYGFPKCIGKPQQPFIKEAAEIPGRHLRITLSNAKQLKGPLDTDRSKQNSRSTVKKCTEHRPNLPFRIIRKTGTTKLSSRILGYLPMPKTSKKRNKNPKIPGIQKLDIVSALEEIIFKNTNKHRERINSILDNPNKEITNGVNIPNFLMNENSLRLKESTKQQYISKLRIFSAWCMQENTDPLQTIGKTLKKYILYRVITGTPKSVPTDINAINWMRETLEYPHLEITPELKDVVQFAKKQALNQPKKQAEPIEMEAVAKILEQLWEKLVLWTRLDHFNLMIVLGFTCGLRFSEITRIKLRDIREKNNKIVIDLGITKTQRYEKVFLEKTSKTWPVNELLKRLAITHKEEPIFGKYSINEFNTKLREVASNENWKNPQDFSSHSLRRGGANYLLKIGKSYAEILKWGRWTSDTALQYLEQENCQNPMLQEDSSSSENDSEDSDDDEKNSHAQPHLS